MENGDCIVVPPIQAERASPMGLPFAILAYGAELARGKDRVQLNKFALCAQCGAYVSGFGVAADAKK